MQVQEVTKALHVTLIHLAPSYVKGLINLRGQIATAIGLRELFGLGTEKNLESMSVVCRAGGNLLSLLVDKIGDVIEVPESNFEDSPDTIDEKVKKFMKGVYKTEGTILSVIGLEIISEELNKKTETN
jgi:purine-binding chemotaxis protein CheW